MGPQYQRYSFWWRPVMEGLVSYERMFDGPGFFWAEVDEMHQALDVKSYLSAITDWAGNEEAKQNAAS